MHRGVETHEEEHERPTHQEHLDEVVGHGLLEAALLARREHEEPPGDQEPEEERDLREAERKEHPLPAPERRERDAPREECREQDDEELTQKSTLGPHRGPAREEHPAPFGHVHHREHVHGPRAQFHARLPEHGGDALLRLPGHDDLMPPGIDGEGHGVTVGPDRPSSCRRP